MNYLKKFFLPLAVIILSLICFNAFRVVPVTKLWKNYSVLYVDAAISSSSVLELLENCGCNSVFCLENQKVPLNVPEKSPEAALAMTGMEKSDYLERRRDYFFDKSHSVKLYYVPEESEKKLHSALEELVEKGINAGINTRSSSPWAAVLVFLAFSAALIYYSRKKVLQVLISILALIFLFQVPLFSVASALILLLLMLFLFARFYDRDGAESLVLKNVCMVTFLGASAIIVLTSGFKFILLYVMLLCSEYCLFQLYKAGEDYFDSKYSFRPVKIRSAKFIPVFTKKTGLCMLIAFIACFVIFCSSFFSLNFSSGKTGGTNYALPAAKGGAGNLPGIDDFVNWKWEAMTFPYRSLYKNNDGKGDTVYFKSYNMNNGLIEESLNSITFNQAFRQEAVESVDSLAFPAIEKILKEQGSTKGFGYAAAGAQSVNLLSLIFMVFAFVIPLVFYVNIKRWR